MTKTKTTPVTVTAKQLRDVEKDRDEYRQMNINTRAEVKQLEAVNENLNNGRVSLVVSMMQERADLIARIARIDQRVNALVGVGAANLQYNVKTGNWDGPGEGKGTGK